MIGWPLSPAWAVACRFGDESQQPIFPQVMHMRRWTQPLPIFRHSSHPSIVPGRAVTSIRSRWLQMGSVGDPELRKTIEDQGGDHGSFADGRRDALRRAVPDVA